jgi:diacylglycerol kinase
MGSKNEVVFRIAIIFLVLCIIMLFMVEKGSAEFVVLCLTLLIDTTIAILSFRKMKRE